jgi:pimeloyl-ACP methyl ester carboxylesterase
MASATVNGYELHYERRGDGEPLLLIQGLSGNHLHWGEPFLRALEPGFALVAYDHRGIGRSGRLRGEFSLADLAGDAAALLDALGIESAHVLGISMGGMVAQELALRHPDRLRSLTLGCTYAGGPGSVLTAPEIWQRLAEPMLARDRERAIRAGFELNVSKAYAADEEGWRAYRERATQLPAPVPVLVAQAQAVAGHDVSARLAEIAVPTLVLHGDEDQMLVVANGRMIAEAIPGARLEVLQGVGHLFWIEQPERTAELVRAHALAHAGR